MPLRFYWSIDVGISVEICIFSLYCVYKNSTAAILLYWLTSDLCQVDYAIDVYKQLHSDEEDPPEPQGNVHLKNSSHFTNTPSHTYAITYTITHRDDRSEEGGGGEAP